MQLSLSTAFHMVKLVRNSLPSLLFLAASHLEAAIFLPQPTLEALCAAAQLSCWRVPSSHPGNPLLPLKELDPAASSLWLYPLSLVQHIFQ